MTSMKLAMLAAATMLTTGAAGAQMAAAPDVRVPEQNIVQMAQSAGFNTLVAAVKAAGLVDALSGAGPFTVFAPTDAAFAKLPAGTLEALLKDPQKLAGILKYHVIAGKVMAADVIKANSVKPATLQGAALDIQVTNGMVHVNNAMVTKADVAASNGVIHVIDTVVLPPAGK